MIYDIAFLGHYTKDTIVSKRGTRCVHGGAINYGANVAVRAGLKVAVITRLARDDHEVIDALQDQGIDVFATCTEHSTCLKLEYPTDDPDKRVMSVTSTAGAFTPEEVQKIEARAFCLGPSLHGEIPLAVLRELRKKDTLIACDVQGYVRAEVQGVVAYTPWNAREMQSVLALIDILKTDAVEAEFLTGRANRSEAAAILASYGPSEIVLTHRDGLLVYADPTCYEAQFTPKELIGRSGRGDTCIGTYMSKRLSLPPEQAILWAAAVTSLKMEAEGPFKQSFHAVEEKIRQCYGENVLA